MVDASRGAIADGVQRGLRDDPRVVYNIISYAEDKDFEKHVEVEIDWAGGHE